MAKRSQTEPMYITVSAESLFTLVQDLKRAREKRLGHYYYDVSFSILSEDDDVVVVLSGDWVDALSERVERDALHRRYRRSG